MRRWVKALWAAGIIIISLTVVGYVGLAVYYRSGFAVNTWINGVYCTGSSVQEVNAVLLEGATAPDEFTIVGLDKTGSDAGRAVWTISMEDIRYTLDYEAGLKQCLAEQSPWLWAENAAAHKDHDLQPTVSIDEEALQACWGQLASELHAGEDYRIEYSEAAGYMLFDGLHNRLDEEKAYSVIREAILAGENSVDLTAGECYYDVPFTAKQEEQARLWRKIEYFQENGPVFDYGDGTEQLDSARMSGFLEKDENTQMPLLDESGRFVLAEGCAENWVEEMAALHDTYNKEWAFQSTRGDIVNVKAVTYGTSVDRKREVMWLSGYLERLLTEAVAVGETGDPAAGAAVGNIGSIPESIPAEDVHIPDYTRDAYNRSSKELGDTYIEVDMGIQKLYYYEEGELKLETDVVTGNARGRMNTPEGVNYVHSKQKNRILRGEGYASPVKFWMPVKGAIGIHDADWRDEFGGNIYKTNGSHGCVNVQQDVMAQLFDMVEIGTPVVMFYGEEPEDKAAT